jgi:hypothetical protein
MKSAKPRPPSHSHSSRKMVDNTSQDPFNGSPPPEVTTSLSFPSNQDQGSISFDGQMEPPMVESDGKGGARLNKEWMGAKSREELEAMLIEADRIIRERERGGSDWSKSFEINGRCLIEHCFHSLLSSDLLSSTASQLLSSLLFHISTTRFYRTPSYHMKYPFYDCKLSSSRVMRTKPNSTSRPIFHLNPPPLTSSSLFRPLPSRTPRYFSPLRQSIP